MGAGTEARLELIESLLLEQPLLLLLLLGGLLGRLDLALLLQVARYGLGVCGRQALGGRRKAGLGTLLAVEVAPESLAAQPLPAKLSAASLRQKTRFCPGVVTHSQVLIMR